MKKVKLGFWILIIGLLALLIFQNQTYFFTKHSLGINLYFAANQTPNIPNLVIIAIFFACGLLIAYLSSLFERYKAGKTIKEMRSNNNSNQATIDQMRREIDALKQSTEPQTPPQASETADFPQDEALEPPQADATVKPPQS